eukprot:6932108-Karenia_brevis.AAC.1
MKVMKKLMVKYLREFEDEDREEKKEVEKREGDKERVVYIETKSKVPRSFKISKDDVTKHTGTKECPGCSAIRRNLAFQQH